MKNLNNSTENTKKIDSMSPDSSEITANENLDRLQSLTMWMNDHTEGTYDHVGEWHEAVKSFRAENEGALEYGFSTSGVYSTMEVDFEQKSICLWTDEIVGATYIMEGLDLAYMYNYGYLAPERQTIYKVNEWNGGVRENAMRLWNYANTEDRQFHYTEESPREWQVKVIAVIAQLLKYANHVLLCDDEDYTNIKDYMGKGVSHVKIHYADERDLNIIGLILTSHINNLKPCGVLVNRYLIMKHYIASYTLSTKNADLVNDYIIDVTDLIMNGEFDEYMDCTKHQTTEEGLYDFIWNYFDSHIIYTREQWEILKVYFTPDNLRDNAMCEAYELLANDIVSAIEICEEGVEE